MTDFGVTFYLSIARFVSALGGLFTMRYAKGCVLYGMEFDCLIRHAYLPSDLYKFKGIHLVIQLILAVWALKIHVLFMASCFTFSLTIAIIELNTIIHNPSEVFQGSSEIVTVLRYIQVVGIYFSVFFTPSVIFWSIRGRFPKHRVLARFALPLDVAVSLASILLIGYEKIQLSNSHYRFDLHIIQGNGFSIFLVCLALAVCVIAGTYIVYTYYKAKFELGKWSAGYEKMERMMTQRIIRVEEVTINPSL